MKVVLFTCIAFIGVLIVSLNSTFGNYTVSVYDLFINPFLFLIYLALSLIFIIWTRNQIKQKFFWLLLIPIVFTFFAYLWKQNSNKNIYLTAIIKNSKGSSITFFDNNTFEIKVQYQHDADFIKGKYERRANEIYLDEPNITNLTDSLFTQKYDILENEKLIIAKNKKFKSLTISE